jgi:hypothetical protein
VHPLDQQEVARRRFERSEPNDLLQADFKGPMGRAGQRDEPLTILDDHSRYALGVYALRDHKQESVERCFIEVFERYGKPRQLLVDHGTPWWSNSNGWGLSKLGVFLMRQGIELIFSGVRHPQTQGKVERFHRTLQRSMVKQGLPEKWEQWQSRYDGFVERYNYERPHEALGMRRPAELYRASERVYEKEPAPWIYPEGVQVMRVDAAGALRVGGHRFFVSEALVHQEVGVEVVGKHALVSFGRMYIRELNLETKTTKSFVHPVEEVLPMS